MKHTLTVVVCFGHDPVSRGQSSRISVENIPTFGNFSVSLITVRGLSSHSPGVSPVSRPPTRFSQICLGRGWGGGGVGAQGGATAGSKILTSGMSATNDNRVSGYHGVLMTDSVDFHEC